jgi:hypothetical protein
MLRSRVGLQARLTSKFFLAKIADYGTFAVRVGGDTLVAYGLRTRRNDSWTGACLRSEGGVGSKLHLTTARLSHLVRLLEMVIPLHEGRR